MKCIFLGYNENETRLINLIRSKNHKVDNFKTYLSINQAKSADIIFSFGYVKIIKKKILNIVNRPIINLHMSLLPFNRGAHPNFWSLIENTPSGITIHEIDEGIDTGKIIVQKRYNIDITLKQFSTFRKTYNFLFHKIEDLFEKNLDKILYNQYSKFKQKGKFTFHAKKNLPKSLKNWDTNIVNFKKNYR